MGRIGARPISDDQQLQLNIQTKGRLNSVADFENIIIRANPDGSILRLRDVARVELGAANLDRSTRLNGGPAAAVAIYQSPGANAITTLKAVETRIKELSTRFPDDLAWKVTYDPTVFVTDTIHEVEKTLVEAFILVVIVVFLFLGNIRATLISDFRRARQPDRRLHRPVGRWLLDQYGFAPRRRARHRHRGRRCNRGGRERRARHRRAPGALSSRRN